MATQTQVTTVTLATECAAAHWLEHQGYHYCGHLNDEGDAAALLVTAWLNDEPTYGDGRAELGPSEKGDTWTATLLTDQD